MLASGVELLQLMLMARCVSGCMPVSGAEAVASDALPSQVMLMSVSGVELSKLIRKMLALSGACLMLGFSGCFPVSGVERCGNRRDEALDGSLVGMSAHGVRTVGVRRSASPAP